MLNSTLIIKLNLKAFLKIENKINQLNITMYQVGA